MKQGIVGLLALSFCLALAVEASAQRPWVQPIESPVVHPDRTVTFSIKAKDARIVELSGQFMKGNRPLKADDAGLWTITVGPLEPNLYPYSFVVDGVSVTDPNNPNVFPNERFKSSLLDVPGDAPALYASRDVPLRRADLLLLRLEDDRRHPPADRVHAAGLSRGQPPVSGALPGEWHDRYRGDLVQGPWSRPAATRG